MTPGVNTWCAYNTREQCEHCALKARHEGFKTSLRERLHTFLEAEFLLGWE